MTVTFRDLGSFAPYKPDPRPAGYETYPSNAIFLKRDTDGADWYVLAHDPSKWTADSLWMTCLSTTRGYVTQAIARDISEILPVNCRLVEIVGHDPADLKPWQSYEHRLFDFATMSLVVPLPTIPDSPSLGDWRVALALWMRADVDGKPVSRLTDVTNAVQALVTAGSPLGVVAQQRFEYSNVVLRSELLLLKGALGFSAADVDESLWRADRVRQGDLSGVWPLPAA